MNSPKTARIRALNDALRQTGRGGKMLLTPGVSALGPTFLSDVCVAMAAFAAFDDANDPYGEHDFGALEVAGQRVFWKIDYYDRSMMAGAEDPADPLTCQRVLTIMLADEY
jgi:hypothetical protein